MKNVIIGLHGKARSGKNEMADIIKAELEGKVPVLSLAYAKPMKDFIQMFFLPHMSPEDYTDDDMREVDLAEYGWPGWTLRKMWQVFGTDCIRNHFGDDTWVKGMARTLEASEDAERGYLLCLEFRANWRIFCHVSKSRKIPGDF